MYKKMKKKTKQTKNSVGVRLKTILMVVLGKKDEDLKKRTKRNYADQKCCQLGTSKRKNLT